MLAVEEKYEASFKAAGGSIEENSGANTVTSTARVSTKILADGTYASEICEETTLTGTNNTTGRQLPNIKSKQFRREFHIKMTFFRIILGW